jgi:hypothetical protein
VVDKCSERFDVETIVFCLVEMLQDIRTSLNFSGISERIEEVFDGSLLTPGGGNGQWKLRAALLVGYMKSKAQPHGFVSVALNGGLL